MQSLSPLYKTVAVNSICCNNSSRLQNTARFKPAKSAEPRLESDNFNTKVDIEKALKLPHLVRTGQFNFRSSLLGKSATIKKRVIKSAPMPGNDQPSNDFQQFLLDHKQMKRSKEEIQV